MTSEQLDQDMLLLLEGKKQEEEEEEEEIQFDVGKPHTQHANSCLERERETDNVWNGLPEKQRGREAERQRGRPWGRQAESEEHVVGQGHGMGHATNTQQPKPENDGVRHVFAKQGGIEGEMKPQD